ncbi:hypothetical protein DPMN_069603, partial [Dreissena polymorpha]
KAGGGAAGGVALAGGAGVKGGVAGEEENVEKEDDDDEKKYYIYLQFGTFGSLFFEQKYGNTCRGINKRQHQREAQNQLRDDSDITTFS